MKTIKIVLMAFLILYSKSICQEHNNGFVKMSDPHLKLIPNALVSEVSEHGEILPKKPIQVLSIQNNNDEKLLKIEKLLSVLSKPGNPGFTIGLFVDGKTIFKKSYGLANVENNIPISDSTLFNIGSIAKQFTAMAAAILVKQNKISLDEDIRKYIPELPDFGKIITIKHLIYHTSGLRDWIEGMMLGGQKEEDSFTHDEVIKYFVYNQKKLNFNPGEEFLYSNTGYSILAEIISRVTGLSFSTWMKQNIFIPLNMKNTHIVEDHRAPLNKSANSYTLNKKREVSKALVNGTILGAGGIYSTLEDLSRWAFNFEETKVGNADILRLMNDPGSLNNGVTLEYAFGQYLSNSYGLKLFAHGGTGAGWQSGLVRCPEEKFVLIALANNSSFDITMNIIVPVFKILFPDKFNFVTESINKKEFKYVETKLSQTNLDEFVGRYSFSSTVSYTVCRKDDHLTVKRSGQFPGEYYPISSTDFVDNKSSAKSKVSFNRDKNNCVISMTIEDQKDEKDKIARKIRPFDIIRNDNGSLNKKYIYELCGKYYSRELKVIYSLQYEGEKLVVKHHWGGDITLTHACLDFFYGNLPWAKEIEFYRDGNNKISGFMITGNRIANVEFEKINCTNEL